MHHEDTEDTQSRREMDNPFCSLVSFMPLCLIDRAFTRHPGESRDLVSALKLVALGLDPRAHFAGKHGPSGRGSRVTIV